MRNTTSNVHVPRVTQIDSKYLDDEIFLILKSTFSSAFQYVGQKYVVTIQPEFETLMKLFLYHYTLGKNGQTIGQQLLQIKYNTDNSSSSKVLKHFYLSLVFASWFKQRIVFITSFFKNEKYKSSIRNLVDNFETIYQCIDVINLFSFLIHGRFPIILERFLNLKVIPVDQDLVRKISYAYFTRELLWNGFTDLLATTLPLIPAQKFHTLLVTLLPNISKKEGSTEEVNEVGKSETLCAVCNELAILPQKCGCKHVMCYYCIYSAINLTPFRCPVCGLKVESSTEICPL
ncbi:Peroxisome biogenesis factor 2 [Armadillidium vulgare]|nr:Peroxisome biogenesis factor 2 [Armadillidium vulgare]